MSLYDISFDLSTSWVKNIPRLLFRFLSRQKKNSGADLVDATDEQLLYSTVTLLARLRGLSTSQPRVTAA